MFCALLLAGAARAQCPYNIEIAELGDRLAAFQFETDSPGSSTRTKIRVGEDPSELGGATTAEVPGGWGGTPPQAQVTYRFRTLTGLAPASTYYFDIQVSAASNPGVYGDWDQCEQQHCPTLGVQPGGYECVQVGARKRPRFTTAAAQGTPPLAPTPPVILPISDNPPAVNGGSFPVALDENGLCMNLQAQMDAAAAADPNLVHEVVVPAGGVCRPESEGRLGYDLAHKIGSGLVIIRCDADSKLLPPPGIRIDPTFRSPNNCSIESNIGDLNDNETALIGLAPGSCPDDAPCTEGWRFIGFTIALADHRKVVRNLWPVVAFDESNGRITVSGDLRGKGGLDALQVHLPGIQDTYAHRSCLNRGVSYNASNNTSNFLCGGAAQGSYEGGGYVSDRISTPLVGCEQGQDPVCETAESHPYGNYYSYSLVSVQGDTATTNGTHRLSNFAGIEISGASGDCNGFYTIQSQNRSLGTVRLNPTPAEDCTGGQLREVGPVSVFDAAGPGAQEANKVHLLDVVDETHIRLLGTTLSGPVMGGWMSVDPPRFSQIGAFGRCARCRLDRVLVQGGGKPVRSRFAFSWDRAKGSTYRNSGGVIHSWVQDLGSWFPIHPITQEAGRSSVQSVLSSTPVTYSVTNGRDVQLRNVANFGIPGIAMLAQSGHETCAEDILVERGFFYYPKSRTGGLPDSEGRYYPSRHFIEFKCGKRIAIRGLDMRQNPANSQPSGAAIAMSIQNDLILDPPGSTARDILIEFNSIWENAGSIDVTGPGSRVTRTESARRIRIASNLVRTNRPSRKTSPSGQSGEVNQPWGISPFYGEFFRDATPSTDVIVENNTIGELMGGDASFVTLGGQFDGTTVFRQNVFPYSRRYFGGLTGSGAGFEPATGNRGFSGWLNHYRRGSVTPDPLSEWDNVAIPCVFDTVASPMEPEMKVVNSMNTSASSDFSCSGGCPSNFNTEIIGGSGQTCLDRQAEFFKERMDYGKSATSSFPAYGVDVEELRNQMGLVQSLEIDPSLETTILINYQAPDAAICHLDYGFDKFFWTTDFVRISDAGGAVERQLAMIDLQPNTTYHFRLLCSADQLRGVFTTGSGPVL